MVSSFRQRGFTLIELLTVMVIILILAGIILGLVKFANEKAARAKAEGEIAAFTTALESYKTDNGTYPSSAADTDMLDARSTTAQGTDLTAYKTASAILYIALSGNPGNASGNNTVVYGKTYFDIPKSELSSDTVSVKNSTGATVTSKYIIDPFGNSFGYSTAYQADVTNNVNPPTRGYNPTYDLWSTSGYGPAKSYPTTNLSDKTILWIKNW